MISPPVQRAMFRFLFVAAALTSCVKKELPIAPHQSGNVSKADVNMDATYKYQVYFSLKNNTAVGQNEKTKWDIGFETSPSGYHIILNSAKSMFALNTGKTDFASVSATDTTGFSVKKRCDSYTGSLDSLAIGDWRSAKPVFIIDRGFNEIGQHLGFSKIQFLSVDKSNYLVRLATLASTEETTLTISKDTSYNLSFLSLTSKEQVVIEPLKAEWDIVFTQYTYMFYDVTPPTPYLVTGCLLNRNNTHAYIDSVLQFSEINFSSVMVDKLSTDISVIGYDWKSFNGTKYSIRPNFNYIIRDASGVYYKLHFTGFYNSSGVKGNPQWEYQRL
ncbi:MAG: HmuY family protein [Chitinophagaceae bacterium]|nr:HmuY family protein [Chitinophagaceae bacterium]